jgi:hypothetical protein
MFALTQEAVKRVAAGNSFDNLKILQRCNAGPEGGGAMLT